MLKDIRIGKRLGLGFGSILVLMGAVAATGYWGLERVADLARNILRVSSPLVEQSGRADALQRAGCEISRACWSPAQASPDKIFRK